MSPAATTPNGAAAVGQAQWQRLTRLPAALAKLRGLALADTPLALPELAPAASAELPVDLPGVSPGALVLVEAIPGLLLQVAVTEPGRGRVTALNIRTLTRPAQQAVLRLAAFDLIR